MIRELAWVIRFGAFAIAFALAASSAEHAHAQTQTTAASAQAVQTTITLRSSVQIDQAAEARGAITLGQIAELSGSPADVATLSAIEVVRNATGTGGANGTGAHDRVRAIDLKAVRRALDDAQVNWGRITLKAGPGGVCEIVWPTAGVAAAAPLEKRPSAAERFVTVDLDVQPGTALSVRQCIARRLAQHFECEPSDLRLAFADADQSRLDTPTAGQRVELTIGAGKNSARVSVGVVLYEGDRVTFSGSFGVEAQVQRTVLVASGRIDRDQALGAGALRSETRWLSPSVRALTPEELAGRSLVAARRVNEGELLTSEHVESPIAARRGDIVWVHCLSGGISVRAKCRAMQTVRDGEVVTLRLESSKSTFQARMSGVGRAVKLADGDTALTASAPQADRLAIAGEQP